MTETKVVFHRLSDRDEKTLTANCSVCGTVAIRKSGNGFQCAEKKKQAFRSWAKANPEKAATNRRTASSHQLSARDYKAATAWCSECDVTVDLIIWGAGYACGNLARQRRTVQQEAPVGGRCRECEIIDGPANAPRTRADGSCPRCEEGPDRYDARHVPAERRHRDDGLAAEYESAGFHITYDDALADGGHESVVPGWKTIGSNRPWNEVA